MRHEGRRSHRAHQEASGEARVSVSLAVAPERTLETWNRHMGIGRGQTSHVSRASKASECSAPGRLQWASSVASYGRNLPDQGEGPCLGGRRIGTPQRVRDRAGGVPCASGVQSGVWVSVRPQRDRLYLSYTHCAALSSGLMGQFSHLVAEKHRLWKGDLQAVYRQSHRRRFDSLSEVSTIKESTSQRGGVQDDERLGVQMPAAAGTRIGPHWAAFPRGCLCAHTNFLTRSDAHRNRHACRGTHGYLYGDAHAWRGADRHTHGHADGRRYGHADCHRYGDAQAYSHANRRTYGDADTAAPADGHADRRTFGDADAAAPADGHAGVPAPYTDRAAHTPANGDRRARLRGLARRVLCQS